MNGLPDSIIKQLHVCAYSTNIAATGYMAGFGA
jgi:hypothetical protein